MLRASSTQRMANLRKLVDELSRQDLSRVGAAALLGCSISASRNYLIELMDAGVVSMHPLRHRECPLYQLNPDPFAVQDFLAGLAEAQQPAAPHPDADGHPARQVWRTADFLLRPGMPPARRDPLVAALFGTTRRC
jgi:hypothetical protein